MSIQTIGRFIPKVTEDHGPRCQWTNVRFPYKGLFEFVTVGAVMYGPIQVSGGPGATESATRDYTTSHPPSGGDIPLPGLGDRASLGGDTKLGISIDVQKRNVILKINCAPLGRAVRPTSISGQGEQACLSITREAAGNLDKVTPPLR